MKKIILSILSIIMILSFVACPEDVTPTKTTTTVKYISGVPEDIFFRDSRELVGYYDAGFDKIVDTAYWGYNDKFINYLVYDYSEYDSNKMTYNIYSDITTDSTYNIGTKVSTTTIVGNRTVLEDVETINNKITTKLTVIIKDVNGNMTKFMVLNDDTNKTVEYYEEYEYDANNRQTKSTFYLTSNLTWEFSSDVYAVSAKDGAEMLFSIMTETKYDGTSNNYDEEIVTCKIYFVDPKTNQISLITQNYTIHKFLWDSRFTSELPVTEIVYDATPDAENPGEYIYLAKSHQIQVNVKTFKLSNPIAEKPCIVSRSWTNSDGKTFMIDTYKYTTYDSSTFPELSDVYYMSEESRRIVGVASEYPSYTSYKNTYDVYKKNGKCYVDNQKYTGYQQNNSRCCETSETETYIPRGGFYAR